MVDPCTGSVGHVFTPSISCILGQSSLFFITYGTPRTISVYFHYVLCIIINIFFLQFIEMFISFLNIDYIVEMLIELQSKAKIEQQQLSTTEEVRS